MDMDMNTGMTWQHEQFLKNYSMNWYSTPNEVCFLVIIQQLPNNIELNYKMHKQASICIIERNRHITLHRLTV